MSEEEEPLILRSQDARGVVTLTLNRPQAFNALSEAMLAGVAARARRDRVRRIRACSCHCSRGQSFLRGSRPQRNACRSIAGVLRAAFRSMLRDDARHPAIAGACGRARAGNRDGRRLSVGRDVRSRSRVEHRPLRRERGKCRAFLFHTRRGTFTKCFAQAGVRNARHRRIHKCAGGKSTWPDQPCRGTRTTRR